MWLNPKSKTRPFPLKSPGNFTTMCDTIFTDKILSKSLTLALFSYPEEFSSWSVDQSCHTYDLKHKLSLCFQTTVQTALAYTPYRLRPLEPNLMTVLALSKGIVCAHSNGCNHTNRIILQSPSGHPNICGFPGQTGANWAHLRTYRHSDP